ncbi:MAG: SoxR reducing system RseC family protein [Deltaproteobacteria bacterium]|nr:SoxR reducing system RseC family protein [Deltaproteobacteria bacterium]MBW2155965.1 SoxR reducing system RseC family protein [Deltaproteobacteria bacterium]MBW2198082.1 SoxR reducing system RseC family protein [Deltaproteobacteria bacterium]MBW2226087.1 SoxR reducing system RseC family protein [Deltaproteobacteria bacterium]MBW2556511.1 SoxR reducing system RseC family protein [Deltaproteobacteria bacterium]
MATEEGIVFKIDSQTAWVKTIKTSSCKTCAARSSCHSLGGGKEMEVEAINRAGAKVGQKVVLSFDTSPLLKATFMLYVFPIIAMVVGAFIGQKMATFLNFDASMLSAIMGFSFFGLTILFVKSRGNKLAKKEEYQPKIIRIIKQS